MLTIFRKFARLSTSTKLSTGITGLNADPSARQNLLKLYAELTTKLCQLPEDYAYRKGLLTILQNREKMIKNDSFSDHDLEAQIGEGQLEELVEQAKEEAQLLEKISNEWKPWEVEAKQQ